MLSGDGFIKFMYTALSTLYMSQSYIHFVHFCTNTDAFRRQARINGVYCNLPYEHSSFLNLATQRKYYEVS